MICAESHPLLVHLPLEALDDTEAAPLEGHLAECAECQAAADALEACYDEVGRALNGEDQVPAGLWDRIVDDVQAEATAAPRKPVVSDLSIVLACTFCHDGLVRADASYCAACLAPHHSDCFAAHGTCSAPGCDETHTVRPQLEVRVGGRRRMPFVVGAIAASIGLGVVAAFAGWAALEDVPRESLWAKDPVYTPAPPPPPPPYQPLVPAQIEKRAPVTLPRTVGWPPSYLSHVRLGQRYHFRLSSGRIELGQIWEITKLGDREFTYDLSTSMNGKVLGKPTEMTWAIPPAAESNAFSDSNAAVPGEETLTVAGRTWECWVVETAGTRSWCPKSGNRSSFPPVVRSMRNGQVTYELIEIEEKPGASPTLGTLPPRLSRLPRVLVLEGAPRWEYRYLKNTLLRKSPLVVQTFLTSAGGVQESSKDVPPLTAIPDLTGYDVVVLGDLEDPALMQRLDVTQFVNRGGGLVLMPGDGGLAAMGPTIAALSPTTDAPLQRGAGPARVFNVPHEGHPSMAALWDHGKLRPLAPLYPRQATLRSGATALLNGPEARPLVASWIRGKGKVIYLATDDFWRWRSEPGADVYEQFWKDLIWWARQR